MGFFSFLTPGEQQEQPNPEGWKVRRKGKDFWEVNPDTPAGPEDEITREDQTPIATAEEVKPYTQRRGETSSQVFQAADKIIDKIAKAMPFGGTVEATDIKRAIRANPDNAAKTIEKFYETAKKVATGTDFSGKRLLGELYDQDFTALEHGVRSLRTMKRGAEEQTLTGKLSDVDLQKNLSELQNLKGQLDALTKEIASAKDTMPEAVSQRGEAENQKALAQKQQKAAALSEHIKQLEAVTKSETPEQPQNAQMGALAGAEIGSRPVSSFMEGLGIKDAVPKVHQALQKVGIPPEEWGNTNVDPSAGVMRVLADLDQNGDFARLIAKGLADAKLEDANQSQSQGKGQTDPAIARTERAIQSKEQEMRALYATLRESPFMRTWPGIILYVLVGMLTQNPAFAARLIGGVGNRAAVNDEIKGIQYQLARLDRELARREREDAYTQREAARRLQRKEDQVDQRKWDLSKMMLQHQLIIKRNASRNNPETALMKKLAADFQRNLGMASKFSGEMQNEFADPKLRENARQNFNLYMRRAAEIDAQINQMGGSEAEQPEEPEE
jgi:hypothetical protein